MSKIMSIARVAAIAGALALPVTMFAQQSAGADNSAQNKHPQTTAQQQHGGASDRETTRKIRQAVVHDKTISTYGHNVKIVTKGGTVTLSGPVHSEDEKQKIGAKATEIAGQEKVTNNLTVK
ncbi:MAG: BON domain-containing protein [Acidobacteriota bacterium]|nr:BON domain-containing protein [Acidobacteriota bacterium]